MFNGSVFKVIVVVSSFCFACSAVYVDTSKIGQIKLINRKLPVKYVKPTRPPIIGNTYLLTPGDRHGKRPAKKILIKAPADQDSLIHIKAGVPSIFGLPRMKRSTEYLEQVKKDQTTNVEHKTPAKKNITKRAGIAKPAKKDLAVSNKKYVKPAKKYLPGNAELMNTTKRQILTKAFTPVTSKTSELKSYFVKESKCLSIVRNKPSKKFARKPQKIKSKFGDFFTAAPFVVDGMVQPEPTNDDLNYVDHSFYKSALIRNESYFDVYWTNITNGSERVRLHPRLTTVVYRKDYRDFAYSIRLPFNFPYYGHILKNITISTGGYLFMGPVGHRYMARDQSISPLMAPWDISLSDDSAIVLYEQDDKITFMWENVAVPQKKNLKFTFGVTLFRNGNIFFIYKDIPIKIQDIDEDKRNVFVGIADSYYLNKVLSYIRRKTIHNYSRIPFLSYDFMSGSILQLITLPSCPIYTNCRDCIGHELKYDSFKCSWCGSLRKCTSGADYFRPYLGDCPFTQYCNGTDDTNETLPGHAEFFRRVYKSNI